MPSIAIAILLTRFITAWLLGIQSSDPAPAPALAPDDEQAAEQSTAPADAPKQPERVHLIVDRFHEIGGHIEDEDKNLLTIRDPNGKVHSYPKSRLIRIVRLLEVDEPRTGMVELRDNTILRGLLIKDDFDEVVIEIEGVRARLPRSSVYSAQFDLTLTEKLARFKEMIEPTQYLRRFELARWLFDEEAYALAKVELESLIADSQMPEAIALLKFVDAQIALESKRPSEVTDAGTDGGDAEAEERSGTVDLKDLLPNEILSARDVNLIRVYEIDFSRPPKLFVSPDSIRSILETYGDSNLIPADSVGRTKLFRADPLDIVQLLFELKARDLYDQIEVQSEPHALNLFRQRVHDAWLIPNCATSRCHGGLQAGRFFLHRRNSRSERVRYTNFLILDRWDLGTRPLLDFDDPTNSLIVQYALPRNEARFPHPEVKGWRPVFTKSNQRLLKDTIGWLERMYQPRPRYPVSFEPPVLDAPDEPVEEPVDPAARRPR